MPVRHLYEFAETTAIVAISRDDQEHQIPRKDNQHQKRKRGDNLPEKKRLKVEKPYAQFQSDRNLEK